MTDRSGRPLRPDSRLSLWQDESHVPGGDMTLGGALRAAASRWPDREAIVGISAAGHEEIRWTYARLLERAERLARGLLEQGYEPGDRLAIWGPNYAEWVLLEYALALAGMTVVTVNPLYKEAELAFALESSGVRAVFHAEQAGGQRLEEIVRRVSPGVSSLKGIHSFTGGLGAIEAGSASRAALPEVRSDSTFMIQYTSGTTGTPKAAGISHGAITLTARQSHTRWGIASGDRVCHGFPLFHIGGSGCCTPGAALVGATTLPLHIFKAQRALDVLESERCVAFLGVPTMVIAMMEEPGFAARDLGHLRHLIIGGAPVGIDFIRKVERAFSASVINCYGQTETCGVTSSTTTTDPLEKKDGTSGQPMPGVSVRIVAADGSTVPHGERGELCYKGPGRMIGYRNPPPGQSGIDANGWFHSGDTATMDAEGYLRIVGRSKEMIIRGGENLSPAEIENLLFQHPAVASVAVVGVPDAKYGEEVCAVIKAASGRGIPAPAEIQEWCRERVSRWKVPRYVVFVDELPLTPSGKIKKYLVREEAIRALALTSAESPP